MLFRWSMPTAVRVDGVLASKRARILETFTSEMRVSGFVAPHVTDAEISGPADACLAAIVRALTQDVPADFAQLGAQYARERARAGYDLRGLLVELRALRNAIVDVVRTHIGFHPGDALERCGDVLNDIATEAILRFVALDDAAAPPHPHTTDRGHDAS